MKITPANKADYEELAEAWEASVRATHDFVVEEDIVYFRSIICRYFDDVDLYLVRDEGKVAGFMGAKDQELQMLFLHPDARGKGLGKLLTEFAIAEHRVTKVEVNEQNDQAVGFYKHMGFKVTGRSDTDYTDRPYPLLFMELT